MNNPKKPYLSNEKGSFLVAGIFFTVIFLMIGGLAIDASRYLYKTTQWQQIADNAAIAGAQALNQYTDDPDISRAYTAVLDYIEDKLGPEYRDLYEVISATEVESIEIREGTANGDKYYRVGLLVYGTFDPYFMPRNLVEGRTFVKTAVAELLISRLHRVEQIAIDCGLFANGDITLTGNNFNTSITGNPAAMCTNGNIDAGASASGVLGDIYTAGTAVPPGGGYGTINTDQPIREMPDFNFTNSEAQGYDVVLSDTSFETWDECGPSALAPAADNSDILMAYKISDLFNFFQPKSVYAGPPGGGPPGKGGSESKELTTKDGQYVGICVNRSESGKFGFSQGADLSDDSMLTGDSIGIYVEGSLNFVRNNTIHGGIYATGDITVESNNNEFIGNRDKLGGLSLWADGNVAIAMNNVEIVGITGAGGTYEFTSPPPGGGNISGFRGLLITNGPFFSADNSASTRFQFDPDVFSYDALNMNEWEENKHTELDRPLLAHTSVRLIH